MTPLRWRTIQDTVHRCQASMLLRVLRHTLAPLRKFVRWHAAMDELRGLDVRTLKDIGLYPGDFRHIADHYAKKDAPEDCLVRTRVGLVSAKTLTPQPSTSIGPADPAVPSDPAPAHTLAHVGVKPGDCRPVRPNLSARLRARRGDAPAHEKTGLGRPAP